MLINDAEGSLVPVIQFTLQEVVGTFLTVHGKLRLSARALINCSYFNSLPSRWEPIIEKFGLEVDIVNADNPKTSIIISMDEVSDIMNLTISEEMVFLFIFLIAYIK